jgi:hypothetical protein
MDFLTFVTAVILESDKKGASNGKVLTKQCHKLCQKTYRKWQSFDKTMSQTVPKNLPEMTQAGYIC